MAITWTLEVANVLRSFSEWNASIPTITFRSLEEDTAQFLVTGDITTACPMSYGQRIRIFRRVDAGTPVCWFVGKITSITARGNPRTQEWVIQCSNFWFDLATAMFQQTLVCYTTCVKDISKKTTKVVLFQDPRTGLAISTGTQIANVIQDAITLGIIVNVGLTPAFVNATFEPARDLTLADVIRRSLQFTPDAVSWVDYSSGAAVVNFQQRDSLTAVSVSLTPATTIVTDFELRKRNDLIPSGVRFNYIGMTSACAATIPNLCVDDTDGTQNTTGAPITASSEDQLVTVTQDTSGVVTTPGALIGTIDLAQLTDSTTETAPVGLASSYYTSLLTPQWDGSITTVEQECAGTLRPGKVLNLTGGNSDWTAMNAVIQEVTENLETGETTASIGPPAQLGLDDFYSLTQMTRRRPLFQDAFAATRAPGADSTNCVAGKDPGAQKMLNNMKGNQAASKTGMDLHIIQLDVCQGGTASQIEVYGPG